MEEKKSKCKLGEKQERLIRIDIKILCILSK
jgi:hypothetical protein